ncbi:hypothetical protein [Sulfitobacter sp. G21635-S1]|uniref:hypothetical protein n=1 Tax=Rhodobacterales TaxID=204455 RepID=UPI0022B07531|nr:hypothetical protein [Sulfitobacter sp. G21635-S1]MCZ4258720.1 hypothetical protein [Sulfitobacter sp. G21635-S1]
MTPRNFSRNLVMGCLLAAGIVTGSGKDAEAGPGGAPIDCAILLCLAGGWPSSPECSAARAEFIRRITPWPVEPPLQIWRCPLGASASSPAKPSFRSRVFEAAMRSSNAASILPPLRTPSPEKIAAQIIQANQADIDISGQEFNFVRSIRVYHVEFTVRKERDYCGEHDATRVGTYGPQGEFSWSGYSAKSVPTYVMPRVKGCPDGRGRVRAVGVEWKDYEGNIGSELVRY